MLEALLAYLILPIIVGASVGSMYFIVSHLTVYDSKFVLGVMVVVTWLLGYSLGLPLSESSLSLFVSLFSSAIGVVVLDSTVSTVKRGEDPPPILRWVIDVITSIRGGNTTSGYGGRRRDENYWEDDDEGEWK